MTENPSASLERDVVFAVAEGIEGNLRRWLRFVGWSEGEWLELQALGVTGGYGERVRFAHADAVASAVALLVEMERRRPTGIYTIANRINPAVATRAQPGRWHDAKKGASTSDRDITHRRGRFHRHRRQASERDVGHGRRDGDDGADRGRHPPHAR